MIVVPIEGGQAEIGRYSPGGHPKLVPGAEKAALLRTTGSVASVTVICVALGLRWIPGQRSGETQCGAASTRTPPERWRVPCALQGASITYAHVRDLIYSPKVPRRGAERRAEAELSHGPSSSLRCPPLSPLLPLSSPLP